MKNWYCKPASEAEAIEIVERALANGVEKADVMDTADASGYSFMWNELSTWGSLNGGTCTYNLEDWPEEAEQLTIQQVREQFPLPHEVNDMSDKKEWQGPQDGLPPVGYWVMSPGGAQMFYVGTSSIGEHVFELEGGGLTVFDSVDGFSQIPNERDKWIERAIEAIGGKQAIISAEVVLGKIYDNMIKEAE